MGRRRKALLDKHAAAKVVDILGNGTIMIVEVSI